MDILNSPLTVLGFFLLIAVVIWFRTYFRLDRKCRVCGKGYMEEIKATPTRLLSGNAADTTSSATVLYNVKYQCVSCKESFERLENRK